MKNSFNLGEIKMSNNNNFQNFQRESQDARRQDQHNAVHPAGRSSKSQIKAGKKSLNNKRK